MAKEGFFKNLSQADLAGLGQNIAEGLRDEWLGIDDFTRFLKYSSQGKFLKALKSLAAGGLELGGTISMLATAGATSPAVAGAKGATTAAKVSKLGKLGRLGRAARGLTLEEQVLQRAALKSGAKRSLTKAAAGANPELLAKELKAMQIDEAGRFAEKFGLKEGAETVAKKPRRWSAATSKKYEEVVNADRAANAAKAGGAGRKSAKEMLDEARKSASDISGRLSNYNLGRIPIGGSRGGILGSAARGTGQVFGGFSTSAGPLARRAYAQRLAGLPVTKGARIGEFASGKLGPLAARTGIDTELTAPFLRTYEPVSNVITAQDVANLSNEELMALLAYLQQGASPGAA